MVSVPQPDFGSIIQEAGPNTAAGMRLLWQALSSLSPGAGGTVNGPASSTVGDVALWNNTTGTLLKDVAFLATNLGDWQLGTWTPTDGSGAGLVFTVTAAKYAKIGKIVLVVGDITFPTTASPAANTINGLPFAASGSLYNGACYCSTGFVDPLIALVASSSIIIVDTLGGGAVVNSNASTKRFIFTTAYITS